MMESLDIVFPPKYGFFLSTHHSVYGRRCGFVEIKTQDLNHSTNAGMHYYYVIVIVTVTVTATNSVNLSTTDETK